MTRRTAEMAARLEKLEQVVDQISRSIEKIEVATIVREPSSALSVDAYNGLRKQIVAAAGDRIAHLHQLARFAEVIHSGQVADLGPVVREWMEQAGLIRVDDPEDNRYYDVLGGEGPCLSVLKPAYVDRITGRPIVMGQAERVPQPPRPHDTRISNDQQEVTP
jgi:hypothetical protein